MTDYSGELNISEEIIKRSADGYRRLRNTLRFLSANISDFDASSMMVKSSDLLSLDAYALYKTKLLQDQIVGQYQSFDFHHLAKKLVSFCSEDLGVFILILLKIVCTPCLRLQLKDAPHKQRYHHHYSCPNPNDCSNFKLYC